MRKYFEMLAIEVVDLKYIIVCIYRSPDSDLWIFLKSLEIVIQIVHSRNTRIILCGDWNLNLMQDNIRLHEVQNLMECYDLMNTVRSTFPPQTVQYTHTPRANMLP